MKKRILSLLLVLLMVVSLVPTAALADRSDTDIAYPVTNGNIYFDSYFKQITDCDKSVTVADIPEQIGGVDVRYIGTGAFYQCTNLTSVTIPDSVTGIRGSAFSGCTGLTSVTIPNSVTSIGNFAFSDCKGLTSITIPSSVTNIGDHVFQYCKKLTEINVEADNSAYSSDDGVLLNKTQTMLKNCPAGKSGEYAIPQTVTEIRDNAFKDCSSLTNVTIANSVKSIGESAFENCSSLTSITIPNGVMMISDRIFEDCTSLASVEIPDSVTSIGSCAFSDCTSLTSVTIPDGVTSIGSWAFSGCTGLTSIDIPNSVTSIGSRAFYNCNSLKSVTIPDGVTSIGSWAFYDCRSLTSVEIPNSVTSIGDYAFYIYSGYSENRDVYYTGSEAEWKEISIQAENEGLTSARRHYGGTMESHIYTDVITEPTCTERGYTTHTCTCGISYINNYTWYTDHNYVDGICTICGAKDPNYVPPHTHDYNAVVTAPTCTEKGYTTYTCSCGDSYKDSYTDALGHDYKNGKCSRCDAEESGGETHTHDYTAVVTAPTCTSAGYTTYTCSCGSSYKDSYTDALGHNYKNGKCTRCGAEESGGETHAHDYTAVVTAPTCTSAGYTTYTCSCGSSYKDSYTDALGHDYKNGKCTRCHAKDPGQTHTHDYKSTVVKATCTEPGYTHYVCSCGDSYDDNYTDALGHRYFLGICIRCGAKDPNAHTHIYAEAVTKPTCTEKGYTTYSCTVCGDSYVGSYTNALGHSYANGKCSRCGAADPDYTPPVTMNFVDVPSGSYCYDAVQWAVANGITKGTDSTHFSPNAGCTRAQVVTFLWRAAGSPEVNATVNFVDVSTSSVYYKAIKWAVANGITKGTDATHFSPNATCTRGQVATFLWRAAGEPAVSGTGSFSDVASGSYCYNAVQWAVANGITKGFDATHFSPNDTCTRGQVVTFLYRAQ